MVRSKFNIGKARLEKSNWISGKARLTEKNGQIWIGQVNDSNWLRRRYLCHKVFHSQKYVVRLKKKTNKKFQSFTWRLLAWHNQEKCLNLVLDKEKMRKGKMMHQNAPSLFAIHQAARVILLFFWAKKDFCSFNFLLLSKRLKASLGNRVYFTHAYLLKA